MYDILFSKTAEKQFLKLEKTVQERIKSALERVRVRPEKHFLRLVGSELHRLRVGNYRVIADIKHKNLLIHVIEVGHRKNMYKN